MIFEHHSGEKSGPGGDRIPTALVLNIGAQPWGRRGVLVLVFFLLGRGVRVSVSESTSVQPKKGRVHRWLGNTC